MIVFGITRVEVKLEDFWILALIQSSVDILYALSYSLGCDEVVNR